MNAACNNSKITHIALNVSPYYLLNYFLNYVYTLSKNYTLVVVQKGQYIVL